MGHESFVSGLIAGANRNPTDAAQNQVVLERLPLDDSVPFVGRSLFATPGTSAPNGHYRTQVIHFGASYSAVEWEWPTWLTKFEAVLVQLVWHAAWVQLRCFMHSIASEGSAACAEGVVEQCASSRPTRNGPFSSGVRDAETTENRATRLPAAMRARTRPGPDQPETGSQVVALAPLLFAD